MTTLLLGRLGDRRGDVAAVDQRIATARAEAQARWPGVTVEPAAYADWIAARLPTEGAIEVGLDGLCLADLYLACACAALDPIALAAFDAAYIAGLANTTDDIKQLVRARLFVAANGDAARIVSYAGRGELGRWVRTVATRLTIDEARGAREVPTEDALLDALGISGADSPEAHQLKQDARRIVKTALREAALTLSDRERTLLLQYHLDGVGVDALGKLYDLAPSNVSRTLARTRVALLAEMRRSLMRHHKLPREELDELVALVRSQLSLTGGLRRP